MDGALAELFDVSGSSTLLFLPLAHVLRPDHPGRLPGVRRHARPLAGRATVAKGLPEFGPTFLLAVPRVFEKVFNTAQQQASASSAKKQDLRGGRRYRDRVQPGSAEGDARAARARSRAAGSGTRSSTGSSTASCGRRSAARSRYAVSGGAPLGERLGHFFRGAGITVLEGYGLTETSAAATVNRPSRNKIGTVGQPLPGVSVRIADDGEILMAGPIVFGGYWRNPEATAEVLDADGWLHTGDIGALDEEGFLSVTGRKKELIVTAGGKNVAPAVLEDRLRAHPLISQCMVVGDSQPFIACLITLDPEALEHWKQQHGKPADATAADLAKDPDLLADLQAAVDDANKAVSRAESIRKFRVLPSTSPRPAGT